MEYVVRDSRHGVTFLICGWAESTLKPNKLRNCAGICGLL
jgi:hypothetical protein